MNEQSKNKQKKATSLAEQDARILQNQNKGAIPSDVLGSYTGTGEVDDVPEQDADDL